MSTLPPGVTSAIYNSDDDHFDVREPRFCSKCDRELLEETDQFWDTFLCDRCAYEPTQSEEREQLTREDYQRRFRELSAQLRAMK